MTKRKATIVKEKVEELEEGDLRVLTAGLVAVRKTNEDPVNEIQLTAILGLISYVAYKQNVREDVVGEIVIAHFGIGAIAQLPARLYENAIDYLDKLKMDKIVN
jgi:hypothetical protein